MTKNPEKIIEQYLDRVRVYLPIDSEDVLVEIRTHLLNNAEEIGQGEITAGSVTMAIERFGEPQRVANEYAGTGKSLGPIPTEYTLPLIRILFILIALSAAFIVGALLVGVTFSELLGGLGVFRNFPFNLVLMIVVNVMFVVIIVGGISLVVDRDRPITERTTIEGIFGFASDALKPRPRYEAVAGAVLSLAFGLILLLPQFQVMFTPSIWVFLTIMAGLMFVGVFKEVLYYRAGENNAYLLFHGLLAVSWILMAMFLINFQAPIEYYYNNSGSGWELLPFADLDLMFPEEFSILSIMGVGWMIFIFVLVVTNIWDALVAFAKIPMYRHAGYGWYWEGNWGERKFKKIKFRRKPKSEQSSTYQDGYSNQQ
jgi:hypothetical protein